MKPIVKYDDSKEELIDRYLIQIDQNPIICTNPLEGTSYNGIPYRHRNHIPIAPYFRRIVSDYQDYLQDFVRNNQTSPAAYEYIETTLTWLLKKFKDAHKQFLNSPLREEWSSYRFLDERIETQTNDGMLFNEPNYKYEIFQFFSRISGSQKYYLKELIDYVSDLLFPLKITNKAITPYRYESIQATSNTIYVFKLTKSATNKMYSVLNGIYSGLKNCGYINCTSQEFRKLFIGDSQELPLKSPNPIFWNNKHYNHLAYFVYRLLSNNIIIPTNFPSNYQVALQLFINGIDGNPFHPKKLRYDNNLNPKDQERIDSIFTQS